MKADLPSPWRGRSSAPIDLLILKKRQQCCSFLSHPVLLQIYIWCSILKVSLTFSAPEGVLLAIGFHSFFYALCVGC
ncbi:hypothetical protein K1719_004204 [Acacia pycnantha]|nr:hypothetical protein K1719_004204 [Acacia pycnantha]